MISRIKETFEFSEVEGKLLSDFQDMLLQMKESATRKDTQRIVENIYCNLISLISVDKD